MGVVSFGFCSALGRKMEIIDSAPAPEGALGAMSPMALFVGASPQDLRPVLRAQRKRMDL